jgi:Tfp pilus assembly protein PilO
MTFENKRNFQKKILVIIGVTVGVLAVQAICIFYLVNYLNKKIIETNQKQRLLAVAKAERLSSVSLQNNFKKIENFLPTLDSVFPTIENLYYFVSQLESLANQTGNRIAIQITSSQVSVDDATGANFVSFNASMNGSYESLKKYLKELNSGRYFVEIDSFSISGSPTVNNESTMNLSGKIFVK